MKSILTLNVIAAVLAVCLVLVRTFFVDLNVRMRYVQLDRAGAINDSVLDTKFHPSYRFGAGDNRNAVPRYIAGPALDQQQYNAFLLLLLALINAVIALCSMRRTHSIATSQNGDPSDRSPGRATPIALVKTDDRR